MMLFSIFFFFQAEDGIRDLVRSRGLGDVYKRQVVGSPYSIDKYEINPALGTKEELLSFKQRLNEKLSLIHI